ncbi:MAG: hypothetical protein KDC61_14975 [Saprospiraceae bacterium]|nr:hypothetical protein [Saprospiraceae bacterium]MCB0542045.1 hypothetical protein [Saprospiraceae bacterium]MCB0575858.1 hypothetical protein [Saprospiraceae bacterium]MCB9305624.1 hypothetical protein [Lewinellaceae bacterium]MCB9354131.1 hypothetical protein [Lewinellaceae bacterium]
MANNFQQWQNDWEDKVPDDIEQYVLHQANTLSHFGRVIELFIPNALQTAAQLIGGNNRPGPKPWRAGRYSPPVIPEGRPRAQGGGNDERLLPADPENL